MGPAPAQRDAEPQEHIQCVWGENRKVCGALEVWLQLRREKIDVARCAVERLMREMGLEAARRGVEWRVMPSRSSSRTLEWVDFTD